MPGCVLRVEIKTSNVEHAIEASGLRPITVLQKGTPRVSPARIARRSIGSTTRYRSCGKSSASGMRRSCQFEARLCGSRAARRIDNTRPTCHCARAPLGETLEAARPPAPR